jgi:WD40 repeat protein
VGSTARITGPEADDATGLRADQRRRWRAGDPIAVEAYLASHPSLEADTESVLDLIYNEVVLRAERGEQPTLAEYERRFPALAEPIRLQFEVFEALSAGTLAGSDAPADVSPEVPRPAGYEVFGELGRGGMGVVYRAVHLALKRPVALKVLRTGGLAGADELVRFRRESEVTARLQHPNVVQIFEVGEIGGRPFLALEYLSGGTLADQVAGGPLDPRAGAGLVRTLAAAVGHAHDNGVVHRDLKPQNVLLAADGTPKIADFGLALLPRGDGVTQSAALVGSPSYMAPEQAGAQGKVGPRADVYALGAVLYELLTGRPPFVGPTPLDTLEQVRHAEPVPIRRLQPKCPRDLETVCLKCLEKRSDQRYPTAAALTDDLDRFLDGRPVTARPVGIGGRAVRWARRRPSAAALLAVSVTSLVLMVTGLSVGLVIVEDRRRTAEAALGQATAATQEKDLALQTATAANREKDEALMGEQAARAAERQGDHATRIALAFRAWSANDVPRADVTLDGCPPECRHWEWAYLKRLCHSELATLDPGGEAAQFVTVAVSPDGRLAAGAVQAGPIHVWELLTGRKVTTIQYRASTLAFSPDGRLLAAGEEVIMPNRRGKPIGSAAGTVLVWEVDGGKLKHDWSPDPKGVSRLAFSPDGQWLAAVGPDGMVRVWDSKAGKPVAAIPLPAYTLGAGRLAFSPDGEYLAASVEDGRVWVWATGTWAQRHVLTARARVVELGFGSGRRLVAVTKTGDVSAWDTADGHEIATIRTRVVNPGPVAVRPDGFEIAVADRDVSFRLLDGRTGAERSVVRGGPGPLRAITYTPDGRQVIVGFAVPGPLAVRDVTQAQEARTRSLPPRAGSRLCFSPDGRFLATSADDGTVTLWAADTLIPIRTLSGGPSLPHLGFSADGRRVAGATSSALVIWDTATGQALTEAPGPWTEPPAERIPGKPFIPRGSVSSVAWSPDGRYLAVAGEKGAVTVWASDGAGLIRHYHTATPIKRTSMVRFHPDGKILAAVGEGGAVSVWDAADGRLIHKLGSPDSSDHGFAFSADGQFLAAANGPKAISVWEVATGREAQRLPRSALFYGLAFSADGRRLVGIFAGRGQNQSELWLWNPQTGQELLNLKVPAGPLLGVCVHPNGRQILAHTANRMFIWDGSPPPAGP